MKTGQFLSANLQSLHRQMDDACFRPVHGRDGAAPLIGSVWSCGRCAIASSEWRQRTHHAHRRRERDRQGAGCAADSRDQRTPPRAVRAGQLCGDRRNTPRGRAVRYRGPYRDWRSRTPRQIRVRRRRNIVSRRGRRLVAPCAGKTLAGTSGPGCRKSRRQWAPWINTRIVAATNKKLSAS